MFRLTVLIRDTEARYAKINDKYLSSIVAYPQLLNNMDLESSIHIKQKPRVLIRIPFFQLNCVCDPTHEDGTTFDFLSSAVLFTWIFICLLRRSISMQSRPFNNSPSSMRATVRLGAVWLEIALLAMFV